MFGLLGDPFLNGLIPVIAAKSPGMENAFFVAGLVLTALVAYILGSFNFALILSKRMYGEDIRNFGSKNAGTTNMARIYGKKAALFTILGDIMKGVVAVFFGSLFMGAVLGGFLAGLFCVIGHIFPVFYKFKGGKGVATAAAVILMVNYQVFIIMISLFILTVVLTRYVSLGSCLAAAIFPFLTYNFVTVPAAKNGVPHGGVAFIISLIIAILVISKHHTNLYRLFNGKESKFSFKKKEKSDDDEKTQEPKVYKARKKNEKKETRYKVKKK